MGPGAGRGHEGLGVARDRDPDRKLRLDGPREGPHLDRLAGAVGAGHGLAAPEAAHLLDLVEHDLLARGEGLGAEDEVVRLPAGGEGDPDAAVREVVDDRPLLGDPQRRVQRADEASGADPHPLGDGGHRGAGDGGVRVEAAERVEVALGGPDRDEAVAVGEARALEQEAVLPLLVLGRVAREVEQAEVHRASRGGGGHEGLALLVAVQHDREAPRERPEQLEHRDVEAQAGDGEPGLRDRPGRGARPSRPRSSRRCGARPSRPSAGRSSPRCR